VKTTLKSLNDLLRAYGRVDVSSGLFSVFSELTVKEGNISGYLKPFFKDIEVYEPKQDEDKGLLSKLYEAVIGGITKAVENPVSDEVATKADVTGPVETPRAKTWQVVVKLIENAFFKAVLPGLEKQYGKG
jgi:hypothetical protein